LAKREFVDAHVHYYDMQHPVLHYGHWQPGVPHPFLGDKILKLAERNFVAEDYIAETRNANVTKSVHVQAAIGTPDPVAETAWLEEAAERTGFPHAIVAHADLRDPDVEATIERHMAYSRMKGIRDFSHGDYLVAPDFHRGFSLLEKYGLISSMPVQWQEMEKVRDLAGKYPNIPIIIDHAGFPTERTDEYFRNWQKGMATAAEADNVICKISGLGMGDSDWTVDSIRPWVLYCIETFTPARSLFASNWPVDWLFSTFDAVVDAYTEITRDFSDTDKQALFSKNTESLYGI
jgi:predicted TIM-barrel fold metal-dependent hydrolase